MDPRIENKIRELLSTRRDPRDPRIRQDIADLDTILDHLSTHEHTTRIIDTALYALEDVVDRATRYLLHPDTKDQELRNALGLVRSDAARTHDRYAARSLRLQERKLIIKHATSAQQRALQSLHVSTRSFRHIPYTVIQNDVPLEELTRAGVIAHEEKRYRIIPLRAARDAPWNLELVGAPKAWETTQGQGISVAVIDTGCDYTHPSLASRFGDVKGYDFIARTDDPMDDNGHGTHCSGSVAGESIGVAPQASLYALKFLDEDGWGTEVGFIESAEWCIDYGVHVANGSFGSRNASSAEEAVCEALRSNGILFAAAAGNDGEWAQHYPASYESVTSVAAVDKDKVRAWFSQKNDMLDISAPGVDVYSSIPGGGFAEYSGTSMACPHTAGCLALLRSRHDDPAFSLELLYQSAESLGEATEYGRGLARVDKAFELAAFVKRWAA